MELGIGGKRALVTGASQGIGRAIAVALAREGARVAVLARRADKLKIVVDEMGGLSAGHLMLPIDLMEPGAPTRAVEELQSQAGPLQIVVHNLGGSRGPRNPLATVQEWCAMWRLNVGIAIEMNRLLVPPMQAQRWGRIIHISSISGETARGSAPYVVAKAALNAYVKAVGRAVAIDNIVFAGVMPGAVTFEGGYWESMARSNPAALQDFLRHHQAIGRLGRPEEVAHFVTFLCSELASFATANVLPIDGGTM